MTVCHESSSLLHNNTNKLFGGHVESRHSTDSGMEQLLVIVFLLVIVTIYIWVFGCVCFIFHLCAAPSLFLPYHLSSTPALHLIFPAFCLYFHQLIISSPFLFIMFLRLSLSTCLSSPCMYSICCIKF